MKSEFVERDDFGLFEDWGSLMIFMGYLTDRRLLYDCKNGMMAN